MEKKEYVRLTLADGSKYDIEKSYLCSYIARIARENAIENGMSIEDAAMELFHAYENYFTGEDEQLFQWIDKHLIFDDVKNELKPVVEPRYLFTADIIASRKEVLSHYPNMEASLA
jgi:hypothetical protein